VGVRIVRGGLIYAHSEYLASRRYIVMIRDLQEDLRREADEIAMERARLVRLAEASLSLDLTQYGLLSSLETVLVAAEATCAALLHHEAEKGVPV
jgi:hypothetical protein